jgi:hypothetical protein
MTERYHNTSPRPWLLWTLSLIALLVAVINLRLALDQAINAGAYRALGVAYPPLLRSALALAWGIGFAAVGIGLARRQPWARRGLLVLVSNYGAFGVLWLVVYARSDFSRDRFPFQIAVTVGLIAAVAWITRWRRIRRAFKSEDNKSGEVSHEESQN